MSPSQSSTPRFADVVTRVQQGEPHSFSELVSSFQDMAVGYAYSILGDFHLAEDAAQEAFLDAYRHLGDLREPLAFPGWLRRILFKHCDRRTRKRSPETVSFDELPFESGARSKAPSPEEIAQRNEMTYRLTDALELLPEKQRAVLVLHYMSGHSLAELSAFLNVPVGTVKKRLHDGRERMREILTDEVKDGLRSRRPSRDARFAEGVVAILDAARRGDRESVRSLLLSNPRLRHGRDVMGNTALILAAANGHQELVALLREASGPLDYHEAAAIGDTERARSLLDENPELLDSFSSEGFTALSLAAHFGRLRTMELLLDRGAGVNLVSRHPIETTALVAALFGRRIDAAKLLIERGADVTLRRGGRSFPRAGWTPLHYAAAYGFLDIASMLLGRGASLTERDASGATPLDVASEEASRMLARKESGS
jgi:RNA polymerase sigma factor (sigma-70 family)